MMKFCATECREWCSLFYRGNIERMKLGGKTAFCIVAFGCAIAAKAVVNDGGNPYHPIVERNVFALKDPPPKPETEEPKGPPPPNITLSGITDVLGRKLALLKWQEPTVPGQPPKPNPNFATLTEGQREGQIEVLEIDVKVGMVKVRNYGVVTNLTFEANGVKLPTTPYTPPPSLIGGIPSPATGIPVPASPQPNAFASTTTTIGAGAGATPGVKTIPSRQLRLPAAAQTPPPAQTAQAAPQNQLSVEEQELLLEAEAAVRKQNQAANPNPKYPPPPPPPPTSLDPTRDLNPK